MPSSYTPPPNSDIDTYSLLSDLKNPTTELTTAQRASLSPPNYYRLAIALLKPLYRLQVWRRSHQRDNYAQEVAQRFGKQYPALPKALATNSSQARKVIWCHAVSLGETNTAAPLLDALMSKGYQIWLTNTTQTGFARGAERFADDIAQGRMSHSYVPVDSPAVIDTFLTHVQPIAALFIETELWANILSQLSKRQIPSILVNGRLSKSSFNSYQKIGAVSTSLMQNLTLIIAQDKESAKRFRQLGAYSRQIRVAGSLKWVINTPKLVEQNLTYKHQEIIIDKKQRIDKLVEHSSQANNSLNNESNNQSSISKNRPIWVAASTHIGEEKIALYWQQQLLSEAKLANTLLIIVPRHPERFGEVAALIQATGLTMARRSLNDSITELTQVYLADTMGELMYWYEQADVALVGGSLEDIGGHNPVEPASVGTPILMGKYTQSCQSVVDKLAEVGALYQPNNEFYIASNELVAANTNHLHNNKDSEKLSAKAIAIADNELIYQQLKCWLSHPQLAQQAGQAGKHLTVDQQSVLTRQLLMIEQVIEQSTSKLLVNSKDYE